MRLPGTYSCVVPNDGIMLCIHNYSIWGKYK